MQLNCILVWPWLWQLCFSSILLGFQEYVLRNCVVYFVSISALLLYLCICVTKCQCSHWLPYAINHTLFSDHTYVTVTLTVLLSSIIICCRCCCLSVCHGYIVAKWCKIGPGLLLITYRKLHTPFQMRWKSWTLDELEGHRQPVRSAILATAGLCVMIRYVGLFPRTDRLLPQGRHHRPVARHHDWAAVTARASSSSTGRAHRDTAPTIGPHRAPPSLRQRRTRRTCSTRVLLPPLLLLCQALKIEPQEMPNKLTFPKQSIVYILCRYLAYTVYSVLKLIS